MCRGGLYDRNLSKAGHGGAYRGQALAGQSVKCTAGCSDPRCDLEGRTVRRGVGDGVDGISCAGAAGDRRGYSSLDQR